MRNEIILLSTRPFIISPMEKEYRTIYKSETRLQQILMIFSLLSIVLSFMGIVGMVAFMIEKRTKEIGIRKINGAKWQDIVKEFWKEFLQLIAVAAIPAVVISFWLMHRWLQQYVYRPAFGWWIFLLVPLFIAAITALILLLQVQGIAKKNPVECLKSD
jgi:putative ABC transport system permease protein